MGTKIGEFRQASRGRGFSPTWFNSSLKVIQMVEIVRDGTALHFNPKDLGLNARFSRLFLNGPELNFRDCFRTVWTEFMDCLWVVLS